MGAQNAQAAHTQNKQNAPRVKPQDEQASRTWYRQNAPRMKPAPKFYQELFNLAHRNCVYLNQERKITRSNASNSICQTMSSKFDKLGRSVENFALAAATTLSTPKSLTSNGGYPPWCQFAATILRQICHFAAICNPATICNPAAILERNCQFAAHIAV